MSRYACVFENFSNFPETEMNQIIKDKFKTEHNVDVNESMVIREENIINQEQVMIVCEIP